MWFKILQLVQFVCSLVVETESRFRDGAGSDKKADVMKSLTAELRKEGMLGGAGEPNEAAVLEAAGATVDSTVELLNVTGAFSHAPKPEPAEEPESAEESAPGG